jgi:hypothetical protein
VQELVGVGGEREGVAGPARCVNSCQQGAPARLSRAAVGWRSGTGHLNESFRFGIPSLPQQGAGQQRGDIRSGLEAPGGGRMLARLVEHSLGRR